MSDLILAYNTNGFYHHTLEEATRIVADFGYNGLALTPDVHHMNPFQTVRSELEAYRALLNRLDLDVVIETGARFILDPLKKHFPTFFTPGRGEERFQFLLRCIEMARILGARIVSFHSGAAPEGFSKKEALKVVGEYAVRLCEAGSENGVLLALEPEPGMVVEAQADYEDVKALCAGADLFLTLDVGHVHITEKDPVHEVIHDYAQDLVNVHLDDAAGGCHEHLPLGMGEIDFEKTIRALQSLNKPLFLSVELSRHGHEAVKQARNTMDYLKPLLQNG